MRTGSSTRRASWRTNIGFMVGDSKCDPSTLPANTDVTIIMHNLETDTIKTVCAVQGPHNTRQRAVLVPADDLEIIAVLKNIPVGTYTLAVLCYHENTDAMYHNEHEITFV